MKQGKKSLQLNERKRKFFRLASGTVKSVFFCVSVKDGLSEMRRLKGGVLVCPPPHSCPPALRMWLYLEVESLEAVKFKWGLILRWALTQSHWGPYRLGGSVPLVPDGIIPVGKNNHVISREYEIRWLPCVAVVCSHGSEDSSMWAGF